MKKMILILAVALSLIAGQSMAKETIIVPSGPCDTIQSATFSTGGGKKIIVYVDIMCKDKFGNYTMFIATKASISGSFGLGRFTIPKHVEFIKRNVNEAEFN